MEIDGVGFCAFGQLQFTILSSNTQPKTENSELMCVSDISSPFQSVSVHCPERPDGIRLTAARTLVSTHPGNVPINVVISSTWDAAFISLQYPDAYISLCSRKWLGALQRLSKGFGVTDGSICKVWECGTHHLLVSTTIEKLFIVTLGAATQSICQERFPHLENFVAIGRKDRYCLVKEGELYRSSFDGVHMTLSLLSRVSRIRFTKVASGANHVLCLTDTGCICSFGLGSRGQLGHGDINARQEPCIIEALAGIKISDIACGHWHSLALSVYKDVYSWGWDEHGQLGQRQRDGRQPVVAFPGLVEVCDEDTSFTAISCGNRHSAALADTGILYLWGWNGYGQIASSNEDIQCAQLPSVGGVSCFGWTTLVWKK